LGLSLLNLVYQVVFALAVLAVCTLFFLFLFVSAAAGISFLFSLFKNCLTGDIEVLFYVVYPSGLLLANWGWCFLFLGQWDQGVLVVEGWFVKASEVSAHWMLSTALEMLVVGDVF